MVHNDKGLCHIASKFVVVFKTFGAHQTVTYNVLDSGDMKALSQTSQKEKMTD